MIELKDALHEMRHNIEFDGAEMFTAGECAILLGELEQYRDTGLTPNEVARLRSENAALKEATKITGDTSDGYHTFNELYHHRAVLFRVICKAAPELAWKSKKHHDGTMYDGMFIVGIQTQDGQATYHYDIYPYWDMFDVLTLEKAPEWDGHTPSQAIERIGGIALKDAQRWVNAKDRLPDEKLTVWIQIPAFLEHEAWWDNRNERLICSETDIESWMPYQVPNEDTDETLFDEQKCRVCGCTWDNACEGGCYWVEPDLCSKCVDVRPGTEENT